jgi:hypothetical protein
VKRWVAVQVRLAGQTLRLAGRLEETQLRLLLGRHVPRFLQFENLMREDAAGWRLLPEGFVGACGSALLPTDALEAVYPLREAGAHYDRIWGEVAANRDAD